MVRRTGRGNVWKDWHKLALFGGVIAFFAGLTPSLEMDRNRHDTMCRMTPVAMGTVTMFSLLLRRVRQAAARQDQPTGV